MTALEIAAEWKRIKAGASHWGTEGPRLSLRLVALLDKLEKEAKSDG